MALNTIDTLDVKQFKRLDMSVGELPSSYLDSMTYYEMLAWLVQYLQTTVIAKINEVVGNDNELAKDFDELRSYVNSQLDKVTELEKEFESFTTNIDSKLDNYEVQINKQFDGFKVELNRQLDQIRADFDSFRKQVNADVAEQLAVVQTNLLNVINGVENELNTKLDKAIEDFNYRFEHMVVSKALVYNTVRGAETTLQEYLDDIAGTLRGDAITAGEYDALELTAQEYDDKEITAYDYDYFGKSLLIPS